MNKDNKVNELIDGRFIDHNKKNSYDVIIANNLCVMTS